MTISRSMETEQSHVTEKILDLTLDIIYLLTGEEQNVIKKTFINLLPLRRTSPITELPPNQLTPEIGNAKKILEVTRRIIELLTREVPIRCQDVAVYFSMEEWEYLEGHKDLYKDVMMADEPDGSKKRNPPQRCPRPRDSSQDLPIPRHDQFAEQMHVEVKIKEEACVTDYKQSTEETAVTANIKLEEPLNIVTDGRCVRNKNTSKGEVLPLPDYPEDNGSARYPPTTNSLSHSQQPKRYHLGRSTDPSRHWHGSDDLHHMTSDISLQPNTVERSRDPPNPKESSSSHGAPTKEATLSSSECRKLLTKPKPVVTHQKSHKVERPYVCSECGKSFTEKRRLLRHEQIHTGERPFSCLECGKHFMQKANLLRHHKSHTGERPYSCLECGKCFILKSHYVDHIRIHTGERPYDCSVCGKCFTQSAQLIRHQRIHTGERPYSCSECGKGFTQKGQLVRHQINHTGERPFSCLECGKRFVQSRDLNRHQKVHKKNFINL